MLFIDFIFNNSFWLVTDKSSKKMLSFNFQTELLKINKLNLKLIGNYYFDFFITSFNNEILFTKNKSKFRLQLLEMNKHENTVVCKKI